MLEMSVVRGVGRVCGMCFGAGWEVLGVSGCAVWARVWEDGVVVCCEPGFSVSMPGPCICILC